MPDQPAGPSILIVDDDSSVQTAVSEFLTANGYRVHVAGDGPAMRRVLNEHAIGIVLLDVMLPGEDGLSLARELRELGNVGVIMLSAKGSEADRVRGLELGADDYLPKPAAPRELLARIRAVQRRYQGDRSGKVQGTSFAFEGWTFDPVRRVLRDQAGLVVSLSEGEFELLLAFVENPGQILSRDQLLELARGQESEAFDRAVDVQVSRLRRKLGQCLNGEAIRTVRGEGYVFAPAVARS